MMTLFQTSQVFLARTADVSTEVTPTVDPAISVSNHTHHNDHINDTGGGGGRGEVGWGLMGKVGYLVALSVVIVLGNILVIASIVTIRAMHRVTNYFLLSLAVADLMVGVFTIPLFILWLTNNEVFTRGLTCNVVLLSCLFVTAASQLNVVAVTIERYTAVCHPLFHRRILLSKPELVVIIVTALWMLSLISTGLSSFAIDTGNTECSYDKYFNRKFLLAAVIVGIFFPFALMVVLNVGILVKIRSSVAFKEGMYQQRESNCSGRDGAGLSKATKTVMMVCCLFLLAWSPFFIVILIHSFCATCHLRQALDLILLLAFTNSAWNPLVYALCNLMFRQAYKQIVTMCCCGGTSHLGVRRLRRRSEFFPPHDRCNSETRSQ